MKHFIHIITGISAVIALSACSHDSNSEYKFEEQTYYRIVNLNTQNVSFARSTVNCTLNPDDKTIQISTTISMNGSNITIDSSTMPYTTPSANTYKFGGTAKASGHDVTNFNGLYDGATNAIYLEMNIDSHHGLYITSIPLFPYTTTTVTNNMFSSDSSEPLILDDCSYGFIFDNTLVDGIFAILNFKLTAIDSRIEEIDYKGITVTPTADGYSIQASLLSPSVSGSLEKYTITDFKADITEQGRKVEGSFTCSNKDVTFSGKAFNTKE